MHTIGPGPSGFTAYIDKSTIPRVVSPGRHSHTCFELLYFIAGESHITINRRKFIARSGDLVIYHPHIMHHELVQSGLYHIICLRFDPQKVNIPLPTPEELEPIIHLPWPDRFFSVFEQIVEEHRGIDSWSQVMVGTLMAQFVVMLRRALNNYSEMLGNGSTDATRRISEIVSLIHRNIKDDITLKDLADRAYMSESHFSHRFKEITGEAPGRYVIQKKIEQAKDLLTNSSLCIADIADKVGYDNPQYFYRLFKKTCACTPGQYRQKSRKVH